MRLGVKLAHQFQRAPAIHQIIHDQHTLAIPHHPGIGGFENLKLALDALVAVAAIGLDRDRVDDADVQLARHDHRGDHAAAGDRHHRPPFAAPRGRGILQAPCQGAGIAVQLIPAYVKAAFMGQAVG